MGSKRKAISTFGIGEGRKPKREIDIDARDRKRAAREQRLARRKQQPTPVVRGSRLPIHQFEESTRTVTRKGREPQKSKTLVHSQSCERCRVEKQRRQDAST